MLRMEMTMQIEISKVSSASASASKHCGFPGLLRELFYDILYQIMFWLTPNSLSELDHIQSQ